MPLPKSMPTEMMNDEMQIMLVILKNGLIVVAVGGWPEGDLLDVGDGRDKVDWDLGERDLTDFMICNAILSVS